MGEKLNTSWQCVFTASAVVGCTKSSGGSGSRWGILSLCSGDTPSGELCPAVESSAQEKNNELVGAQVERAAEASREILLQPVRKLGTYILGPAETGQRVMV